MTDAELLARAATGSEHAFRSLYRTYATAVYRVAYAILGNAHDAEDVTQETFVTAWTKARGLRLESDSALPWLATICRNHAANRLRRRWNERRADPLDETAPARSDVEQSILDAELARRISDEVAALSPLDRDIFLLCVSEGIRLSGRRGRPRAEPRHGAQPSVPHPTAAADGVEGDELMDMPLPSLPGERLDAVEEGIFARIDAVRAAAARAEGASAGSRAAAPRPSSFSRPSSPPPS